MSYSIIQPPFTLKFRDMPKHELDAYRKWFLGEIPTRISMLRDEVNSRANFENWVPDRGGESLTALGFWLAQEVETRARTSEELNRIKGRVAFDMDVSERELTNKTFSLAMDTGMYFGETLLRHHPNLSGINHSRIRSSPILVRWCCGGLEKFPSIRSASL